MTTKTTTSIGEIAIERGYLTNDQLEEAMLINTVVIHKRPNSTLGLTLVDLGFLTNTQLKELETIHKNILEEQINDFLPDEVAEALKNPSNRHGKFVRIQLLGRGGLGEVWKAYDITLRRTVAIKFINTVNEDHWKIFIKESEILGKLQHPNIVPLFEIGNRFIVMPYINGRTLDQSELNANQKIDALRQTAIAIEYAHKNGILHRDIKPTNIMIELLDKTNFHVWVTDFGIAKDLNTRETILTTGMILGTPAYMPPEHIRGNTQNNDIKSDIYSLGATLYHLVIGKIPFAHEDLYKLMKSIVEDEPLLGKNVPRDLRSIIQKSMSKIPAERYGSSLEFAEDLNRFLINEPVKARNTGIIRRTGRKLFRNKIPLTFAALALFGFGFGLYGFFRDTNNRPPILSGSSSQPDHKLLNKGIDAKESQIKEQNIQKGQQQQGNNKQTEQQQEQDSPNNDPDLKNKPQQNQGEKQIEQDKMPQGKQ